MLETAGAGVFDGGVDERRVARVEVLELVGCAAERGGFC